VSNPTVKTASVAECWTKTPAKRKVTKVEAQRDPTLIQPGQQFILSFGNNTGHTGLVESIETTNEGTIVHTIEGNSNSDGGREGYAVVRHQRKLTDKALLGFIRYT
jgi:hypothetical protein